MTLSKPTMSALRFGYGIRPGEQLPNGADALLAQLDAGAAAELRFPAEGIKGRWKSVADYWARAHEAKSYGKEEARQRIRPIRREIRKIYLNDQHARVIQSALSPYGFHERLATFWLDHFSVSGKKQRMARLYTPLYEAEAIRPNMAGSFSGLLTAVIHHPAMLTYLDQIKSAGPNSRRGQRQKRGGLNENLGRELLELHTLGVDGGYTQKDVRDAALVLTGLTVDRDSGRSEFRQQFAEPGPLEFMGKTYGGRKRGRRDVDAMLDDLAADPRTGRHICRKLAVHFISDTPPEALVAAMDAAWTSSGGNLREVYAAMLRHPAAWENPGEKARQPYDFLVAGLRALDVPQDALTMPAHLAAENMESEDMPDMATDMAKPASPAMQGDEEDAEERAADMDDKKDKAKYGLPANPITVKALKALGQPVWEPASPAGFDEAFGTWISSGQITLRIEWAQRVAGKFGSRVDATSLLKETLRDAAREDTITVVRQAPNRTAGIALVLASPEFNRR